MLEDDLNRIQEVLTHQEKQIFDLNDMVTRQWKEIDRLKAELEKTRAKLNVLEETAAEAMGEKLSVSEEAARNKPPHY
ncbi:MAG: SlyX family protein [Rhodospirillales bacterium]|nr:SlyX family protein [Alphaproteobacteria bacterium]USO04449.1 MAG: SlyX family protein [Rhodospirillales bacterium]